ncbi:HAD hydrolase family protein [Plantibacter sp. Mn2098]
MHTSGDADGPGSAPDSGARSGAGFSGGASDAEPRSVDLSRIRLVVSDLDGTLLGSGKRVSRRTVQALVGLRDAGIRFAVASARPLRLIEEVLDGDAGHGDGLLASGLVSAVMASNGAARFVPRAGDRGDEAGATAVAPAVAHPVAVAEVVLSAAAATSIIEAVRTQWPEAGFGWELGHTFACDRTFQALAERQRILRDTAEDTILIGPAGPVHQLVFAVPDAQPRDLLARTVQVLDDAQSAAVTVTDSDGGVVEIASVGADKAVAASAWAHSLGESIDHVLAFGDELNDIALLAAAGVGVAMGNARPEVAAHADLVTATNDEDGVAVVLELLLAARGAMVQAVPTVPGVLPVEAAE